METPQDPLARYFVDKTFLGFTSSSLFHFRSISLCPCPSFFVQEKRLLAQSLQQSVLCYLCLKTCLSPTHSSEGCSSLGSENITLSGFPPGLCPMDHWSLFLPSSPHPKRSAFYSTAVLQTEHRTPAERSPVWGLCPAGCGPICSPILCFPFFPFYCATAQHCQFMFNQRSTVTSVLS